MSSVPNTGDDPSERYAFPLMAGGALHRALTRAHLSGPALQFLHRRILAILTVTWLPLLALSILEGHAWDGIGVPFLKDIGAQTRLLISLPLLLVAEGVVQRRILAAIPLFADRGLIEGVQRGQLVDAIASGRRWLDSVPAELLLVALVYAVALSGSLPQATTLTVDTWHGKFRDGRHVLTLAGWWVAVVSLPLYQFLLVRWYFRLLVWWRFLWQVAKIELKLQPLHPDRMAGLGFLSRLSGAFALFLLAQGVMASGVIADQILYGGAVLSDFRVEIVAAGIFTATIVIGPLFAFVRVLSRAKQAGLLKHEALSMRYARQFDRKWSSGAVPDEPLLGNADVQTLADLGNSYEPVRRMIVLPIDKSSLILLLAAALAPMLPLLLTMFSLKEMALRVISVLF